ncbi:hypothetical protein [Photorhabdus sp. RM71S]|uniref:hypothetical protein n=1 Tax=Photorhabdus sp. RM71S TaxID=3342824 RepID=UPI0036DEBA01
MSDKNLAPIQVSAVEFDHTVSPRVIVTVKSGLKYGIHWEDKLDEPKYIDHSLVIYNILLMAMSHQDLRISGKYEYVSGQDIEGMIKTLKIAR